MPNTYFQFKEFRISQKRSGMKVTTDACLFGAWVAEEVRQSHPDRSLRILDIGTGTGLLSLMVAQKIPNARIVAVEKDPLAAAEATKNFAKSSWSRQLACVHSPIQTFSNKEPFDIILANPPFFSRHTRGLKTRKNSALHDDSLSMTDLIFSIETLLKPKGVCFLLYPVFEMTAFKKLIGESGFYPSASVQVKNTKEGEFLRKMCGFTRSKKPISTKKLIIKEADNHYTQAFWELLSPYYLEYNNPANRNPAA